MTGLQDEQDGDFWGVHVRSDRARREIRKTILNAGCGRVMNGDEQAGKKAFNNGLNGLELV